MKRKIFATLIVACLMLNANAQDYGKSTVYLGYGRASIPMMGVVFGTVVQIIALPFGISSAPTTIRTSGVLNLGYRYAIGKKFSAGLSYSFERITLGWEANQTLNYQSFHDNMNCFMGDLRFIYFQRSSVDVYARLGMGSMWYQQSNPSDYHISFSKFAFQLTPIGISFGRKLQGFCELGVGHQGITNFGAAYRF